MRALGLRVEPKMLHWAVVEGSPDEPVLVAHDKALPPARVGEPETLSWYRERLRFLVEKYVVDAVGVRLQETHGRRGDLDPAFHRSRIEGVLLEAAYSCGKPVVHGALNTLSSKLKSERAKRYLEQGELRGVDLASLPKNRPEAVLVGVAALSVVGTVEMSDEGTG